MTSWRKQWRKTNHVDMRSGGQAQQVWQASRSCARQASREMVVTLRMAWFDLEEPEAQHDVDLLGRLGHVRLVARKDRDEDEHGHVANDDDDSCAEVEQLRHEGVHVREEEVLCIHEGDEARGEEDEEEAGA